MAIKKITKLPIDFGSLSIGEVDLHKSLNDSLITESGNKYNKVNKITSLPFELNSIEISEKNLSESLHENKLTEAKRYVRRYYIRPQDIFCSNKAEIIKALIDIGNENCSVYTLINLGDDKDINKLTNDDIIYYYDDGILYDKNKVKVMDYDLYIKHEEKRDDINPDQVSDKTFNDVYDDRMTQNTIVERWDWETDYETEELTLEAAKEAGKEAAKNGEEEEYKRIVSVYNNASRSKKKNPKLWTQSTETLFLRVKAYIDAYKQEIALQKAIEKTGIRAIEKLTDQQSIGKAAIETVINDSDEKEIVQLEDWLEYHVTRVYFSLPSTENIIDKPKLEERIWATATELERKFPGILSDTEHFKWEMRNPESQDSYYGYWGLSGHVIFDVPYIEFPEELKELIKECKQKSIDAGRNATFNIKPEQHIIDNIYFAFAILELFNNDLNFYLHHKKPKHELDLAFPDVNAYGESLKEGKEVGGICCICGEEIDGYGNNPEPYKHEGRCCDACNYKFVIPARLEQINNKEEK